MKRWKIVALFGVVIVIVSIVLFWRTSPSFLIASPTPYEILGLSIASIAILLQAYSFLRKPKLVCSMPDEIERTENGFIVDLEHRFWVELPLFITNQGSSSVIIQSVKVKTLHRSHNFPIELRSDLPISILPNHTRKIPLLVKLPHLYEETREELLSSPHEHGFLGNSYCDIFSGICYVELHHSQGKVEIEFVVKWWEPSLHEKVEPFVGKSIVSVARGARKMTDEENFLIHLIELERFNFPNGVPIDSIVKEGKKRGFSEDRIQDAISINTLLLKDEQGRVISYLSPWRRKTFLDRTKSTRKS